MHCVIHYSEIGTKGGNRPKFEKQLAYNIEQKVGVRPGRIYGRLVMEIPAGNITDISNKLEKIPGIADFAFAVRIESDMDEMKKVALDVAEKMKRRRNAKTFRIASKRSWKGFPLTSLEVNENVGAHVVERTELGVDLDEPDFAVHLEITDSGTFVYSAKHHGIGGMPVGDGRVLALLSGGIDSPVAAQKMMKRGCAVSFVHFHNYEDERDEKIAELVRLLNAYQNVSRLYVVPFLFIQNELVKTVPAGHRMIVYRRVMFRIARLIAEKEGASAFVTGDSVGQVASQTLQNYSVISEAAGLPVLSPLVGMTKNEIINDAKRIGTYETSIRPYKDCCTFMVADHPETSASLSAVREMEGHLNIDALIKEAAEKAEVMEF